MASACALAMFSGKNIYNFAILENLRIFQNCLFTGGGVKASLQKYQTQKQGCCTRFCAAALFTTYILSSTFFPVSGSGMPSSASMIAMRIYTPLCT